MARGAGASGWGGGGSGAGGAKGRREQYQNDVGGFQITLNGRERTYFKDASGSYRDIQDATGLVISAEQAQKLLANGKIKPLSKSQVRKIKDERRERRAKEPGWELGLGIPWGNKDWRLTARKNRLMNRIMTRKW